jgi:hypothetical protein
MKLRAAILSGLAFALLTILFSFGYVLFSFPRFLLLLGSTVLWYGYAAIYKTQPATFEDAVILRRGLKWGVATACAFAALLLTTLDPETFVFPAVVLGLLLPFSAGASGAIPSGRVLTGTRIGFWSGMIGSLLGFFILAAGGYLEGWLSGVGVFAFMESSEYLTLRLAVFALVIYGPVFSPIVATIGGWIGLKLARTGGLSPAGLAR